MSPVLSHHILHHRTPLPAELILLIAAHILVIEDLNSFAQTSRHIYNTVNPTLYRAAVNPRLPSPDNEKYENLRDYHLELVVQHDLSASLSRMLDYDDENLQQLPEYARLPRLLLRAVHSQKPGIVDVLLNRGVDVNYRFGGDTPLHMVARWANLEDAMELLRLLVGRGAGLEVRDAQGRTPLFLAAVCRQAKGVEALLGCGAEIDAVDQAGRTPLKAVVMEWRNRVQNLKCLEVLVQMGGDTDGAGVVHAAAWSGRLSVIEALVKCGVKAGGLFMGKTTVECFEEYCVKWRNKHPPPVDYRGIRIEGEYYVDDDDEEPPEHNPPHAKRILELLSSA